MSKYVLLSHVLNKETPSYCDRDRVVIRTNTSIKAGDTANTSCLILTNNHIGTHIDVPRHFDNNGKRTVDYPISHYVFHNIALVDIPVQKPILITSEQFEDINISDDIELLLIRTGFEQKRYFNSYWNANPGLQPELAKYLRNKFHNLRCVGFDLISVTSQSFREEGKAAHRSFLCPDDDNREIMLIEDMSLKNAPLKIDKVIVAPLMVEDGNGAPVTVIAEIEQ